MIDKTACVAPVSNNGFLRLLGLSAKTLVIDEVHAYDEYMTTIMKRLLEWCRTLRINVILLSATLSQRQKRELCESYAGKERAGEVADLLTRWSAETIPYPLVTCIPRAGRAVAIPVDADRSRSRDIILRVHPGLLEDFEKTAQRMSVSDSQSTRTLQNSIGPIGDLNYARDGRTVVSQAIEALSFGYFCNNSKTDMTPTIPNSKRMPSGGTGARSANRP